jgi:molybdopterin synthase catalytic subunit
MVELRVLYFAKAREVVGKSEEAVTLAAPATAASLQAHLVATYPDLASVLRSCVFALNQEYVQMEASVPLKDGDEVAVIPPLSGG